MPRTARHPVAGSPRLRSATPATQVGAPGAQADAELRPPVDGAPGHAGTCRGRTPPARPRCRRPPGTGRRRSRGPPLWPGSPGPVPVPDAVVETQDRAREEPGVGLGNDALLHSAREERGPRELEVAHPRSGELSDSSSRGELRCRPTSSCSATRTRLRSTSCSAEVERGHEHGAQRPVRSPRAPPLSGRTSRDRPARHRLDLVQAVELGLEVVIERGRADTDRLAMSATCCTRSPACRSARSRVDDVLALAAGGGARTAVRLRLLGDGGETGSSLPS